MDCALKSIYDAFSIVILIILDCLNNFVRIEFDSSTSTVACVFLDQPATADKVCSVTYSVYQQGPTRTITSDPTKNNTVKVMLEAEYYSNQILYFIASATSGEITTKVEGKFGEHYCMMISTIHGIHNHRIVLISKPEFLI